MAVVARSRMSYHWVMNKIYWLISIFLVISTPFANAAEFQPACGDEFVRDLTIAVHDDICTRSKLANCLIGGAVLAGSAAGYTIGKVMQRNANASVLKIGQIMAESAKNAGDAAAGVPYGGRYSQTNSLNRSGYQISEQRYREISKALNTGASKKTLLALERTAASEFLKASIAVDVFEASLGRLLTKLSIVGGPAGIAIAAIPEVMRIKSMGCAERSMDYIEIKSDCTPFYEIGPQVIKFLKSSKEDQRVALKTPGVCEYYHELMSRLKNREVKEFKVHGLTCRGDNSGFSFELEMADGAREVHNVTTVAATRHIAKLTVDRSQLPQDAQKFAKATYAFNSRSDAEDAVLHSVFLEGMRDRLDRPQSRTVVQQQMTIRYGEPTESAIKQATTSFAYAKKYLDPLMDECQKLSGQAPPRSGAPQPVTR